VNEQTILPVDACARPALSALLATIPGPVPTAGPAPGSPRPPVPHTGADGESIITLTVYGTPGPQGSKTAKGRRVNKATGKCFTVLVESSKKVKPWRELVAAEASSRPRRLLLGPLAAEMVFSLQPPRKIPADRFVDGVPYPAAYPDTSKLARSTEDALTGILWHDDAQIVDYRRLAKLYAGYPGALDRPGVVIRVWRIGGAA